MLYFSALTTVEQISPTAKAVLDSFGSYPLDYDCPSQGLLSGALPAALRAVADQLFMEQAFGDTDADAGVFAAHHAIRVRLLEIAAELEAVK